MKYLGVLGIVAALASGISGCGEKNSAQDGEGFTRIDSLRENYLTLQDSMLQAWNIMVKDETGKIQSMHKLLHSLLATRESDKDKLVSLEQRLEQLDRIRFSEKTMANPHLVEEYDFASNSIISETLSLTESDPQFASDIHLQVLTDEIRSADQRVVMYRMEYDAAASNYNRFLEENKEYLNDIDDSGKTEVRPLFEEME